MTWLQIKGWIADNLSWLGFIVMACIGAIVGHVKAYEASNVEWTLKQHLKGLAINLFYALFIALVICFTYKYTGASEPIAFVTTGVLSVFGSKTIDLLYEIARQKALKRGEAIDENQRSG